MKNNIKLYLNKYSLKQNTYEFWQTNFQSLIKVVLKFSFKLI